jgi:hypothetical protein
MSTFTSSSQINKVHLNFFLGNGEDSETNESSEIDDSSMVTYYV